MISTSYYNLIIIIIYYNYYIIINNAYFKANYMDIYKYNNIIYFSNHIINKYDIVL